MLRLSLPQISFNAVDLGFGQNINFCAFHPSIIIPGKKHAPNLTSVFEMSFFESNFEKIKISLLLNKFIQKLHIKYFFFSLKIESDMGVTHSVIGFYSYQKQYHPNNKLIGQWVIK